MKQVRKYKYWLLLAALLPILALLLVGNTYARYDTTVYWNTIIAQQDAGQYLTAPDTPILSKTGDRLDFQVSVQAPVDYTLERLDGDGYVPFETDGMQMTMEKETVTLTLLDAALPPGTYRLRATWTEVIAEQTEKTEETEQTKQTATATFFINYSDAKTQEVTE